MLAVLDAEAANPSSVHQAGYRARATVDAARTEISRAFHARRSEVVFTSGGTEANALAIVGLALAHPRGRHIVTTPIEHPSVLESARMLERRFGYTVDLVEVSSDGRVRSDAVAAVIRDDTTLVSVGLANAEIGTVQDLPGIAEVARARGALVHSDAVQAAAGLPVSFASHGAPAWPGSSVDALTIAAHKFGGPQGAGALLLRSGVDIEPILHGGGQEGGRRSGTENVAAIAGFGAAVRAAYADVGTRGVALIRCRDALIAQMLAEVPGARLTGHPEERLPGHASFVVEGVSGESLLVALDAAGVAVSSGSACAAGAQEPSPALLAVGLAPELAHSAIRFTFSEVIPEPVGARIVAVLREEARSAMARRRRGVAERPS